MASFSASFLLFFTLAAGIGYSVQAGGSTDVQAEGKSFTITSSNGSFILDCGPDCRRKVGNEVFSTVA